MRLKEPPPLFWAVAAIALFIVGMVKALTDGVDAATPTLIYGMCCLIMCSSEQSLREVRRILDAMD